MTVIMAIQMEQRRAIKVLAGFREKTEKFILRPGLVEMGSRTEEVHTEIGKKLSSAANLVILIRNSVTPFIAKVLKDNGFDEKNIIWFDTGPQAHEELKNILKPKRCDLIPERLAG